MIITVTMNPAVDKTVSLDKLYPGGLNRIRGIELDAGGKGINVSKTIRALGGESIATGFLGGGTGQKIKQVLDQEKIPNDFVWVEGETRTNTKVLEQDGRVTELNEPGPPATQESMEQLTQKLTDYAGERTLFLFSGSTPGGVDAQSYARLIHLVHERGAAVLLDADGELFRKGLSETPEMVKPNCRELEEYAGYGRRASQQELLGLARGLKEKGIRQVAVSMGEEGALFILGDYEAVCPALPVKAHSTVGAGDAMVAALACAWNRKLEPEETVRLCMAASAGAVTTTGTKPPPAGLVEELKKQVVINRHLHG